MNNKCVILKGIVLSALILGAFPAWSANNYNGRFALAKYNSGFSDIAMRTTSSSMCFLARVGVEETDTNGERSTCTIYHSGGWWRLKADTGRSSDNDIHCSAICYTR